MRAWLAGAVLLTGCPKKIEVPSTVPIDSAPYVNGYLHSGNTDVLGAFAPTDRPLDAANVQKTACSEYFRVADDEGHRFEGVFQATPAEAEKHGVVLDGRETYGVWLDYQLTGAKVAVIHDPQGLRACCAKAETACSEEYVAEIVKGKGQLYWATESDAGPVWSRGDAVKGSVGFRLSGNPFSTAECGVWREAPPRADGGTFFVGVSNANFTEKNAREAALRDARDRAKKLIRSKGLSDNKLSEMSDERWCVESFPDEHGKMSWLAHVLTWLPE